MSYIKVNVDGKDKEFWVKDDLDNTNANYRIAFSERGPGKSYQIKKQAIDNWLENGKQFAMVRRLETEIKVQMVRDYWSDMMDYFIEKAKLRFPDYEYFTIDPRSGQWTIYGYPDITNGTNKDNLGVIGHYFALNISARYKSVAYPDITMLVLEEFMAPPGSRYLPDEFNLLTNLISTIKRHRTDFVVYLLGNTVDRDNPLLKAMNINIDEITQGEIKKYTYYGGVSGNNTNTVAVEYVRHVETPEESESFFVFNRPQEDMIIKGDWQTKQYKNMTIPEFYQKKPKLGVVLDNGFQHLYMYFFQEDQHLRAFVSKSRCSNRCQYITISNDTTNLNYRRYNINSNLPGYQNIIRLINLVYCNESIWYENNICGCDFENIYQNIGTLH